MKRMFLCVLLSISFLHAQTVYFVKPGGDDNATGTSWAAAFATLQKALGSAASGNQIWVSAGTYTPSTNNRSASFNLKNGVAIYGGFAGTESDLVDRNWSTNVCTLTGDIDGDGTLAGNSYHVVYGISVNGASVLDGFVISGGNAADLGGGIELLLSSPTLSHLTVTGNSSNGSSTNSGGGLYNAFGSPVITDCTFSSNHTTGNGGGMYNGSGGAPSLTYCKFIGNTAVNGGGMYNDMSSVPTLANIIFKNDTATTFGGGFYNSGNALTLHDILFVGNRASLGGGGAFNQSGNTSFINNTFYNDSSKYGGGLFITGSSTSTISNSIFWNDSAGTSGSEVYNTSSGIVTVAYSLLRGGISGAEVGGASLLTDGGNNIDSDPLFTNPGMDDLSLSSSSPAIDAGNNSAVTAVNDLASSARVANGTVDLGAYEFQGAPLPVEIVSLTVTAHRVHAELRWSTASEVNNYGFEVERSRMQETGERANERRESWVNIGFIEGAGTSNVPKQYAFTEKNLSAAMYEYRLKQIDRDGKFKYSKSVQVEVGVAPAVFELSQNYPNPFNPSTNIDFTVPTNGRATLKLFNMLGQEVATLFNEEAEAGKYHQVIFNGAGLASGTYISRLVFEGKVQVKKLMLLK